MKTEAQSIAEGRWHSILTQFGIDTKFLVNRHGPCPICGGKDRFRFSDQNIGRFICNNCGSGDGYKLIERITGEPFRDVVRKVKDMVETIKPQIRAEATDEARQKREMQNLWDRGRRPTEGGIVSRYINSRIGQWWSGQYLREVDQVRHPYTSGDFTCMMTKITDPSGKPCNIHLTYLTEQGRKATVEPPKRVLAGKLTEGSAIRLSPSGATLGLSEGIETAMAASLMFGVPCWAAISGTMMAKWIPPEDVKRVIIFADNDGNYTGQAKAYALANRLVVQSKLLVEVRVPELVGEDWADVYEKKLKNI